jgi:hypothetical protein
MSSQKNIPQSTIFFEAFETEKEGKNPTKNMPTNFLDIYGHILPHKSSR